MDTKWLEDFVVLAETRSFSRAARMRNITQPAFSRRVQALEGWLGFSLVDRTTYPPCLTTAGESFYKQAQDLLGRIGELQSSGAGQPSADDSAMRIAVPHTLSLSFLPQWLSDLQRSLGPIVSHLQVGNMLDVVLWLVEGGCDLLICWHHPQQPIQLDPERFDMLRLGVEKLAPYALSDGKGRPRQDWPGKSQAPVPYLAYSSSAYLGRMAEIALAQGRTRPHLRRMCETDMAEGLKRMLLAGHGVAFLPDNTAAPEHAAGVLVRLEGGWEVAMDIHIYRERPTLARPSRPRVEQLWRLLESQLAQVAHDSLAGGGPSPASQVPRHRASGRPHGRRT